jgi:hypothetical protein
MLARARSDALIPGSVALPSPPRNGGCPSIDVLRAGAAGSILCAMPTPPQPVSSSFELRVQQSEQARVGLFIGVLLALAALIMLRHVTGGVMMNSPVYWWTLGLLGAGLLYESWMFFAAKRANIAGRLIGDFRWRFNAAFEVGLAIGLLVILLFAFLHVGAGFVWATGKDVPTGGLYIGGVGITLNPFAADWAAMGRGLYFSAITLVMQAVRVVLPWST